MIILLSPAKSFNERPICRGNSSIPLFENEAQQIVKSLKKLNAEKIGNLMSISKELAMINELRFKTWDMANSDNNKNYLQAIRAFSGEVYRGFEAESLVDSQFESVQNQIRILSGLYGVLKPFDLISPYRLEMGTKFSPNTKAKNLYEFWKAKVTKALNSEIQKDEIIINLASTEYFKVIDQKTIKSRIITPTFKEFKNGKPSIVMMYAKNARGKMGRFIVNEQLTDVENLKLYNQDGYFFDEKSSTDNEWVFIR